MLMFCYSGPHTIADLQQKLVELTSQPSELTIGTPPSQPTTPHVQLSYQTYMQSLQQKLASISMVSSRPGFAWSKLFHRLFNSLSLFLPQGPSSPHTTLHSVSVSEQHLPEGLETSAVLVQPIPAQHITFQPILANIHQLKKDGEDGGKVVLPQQAHVVPIAVQQPGGQINLHPITVQPVAMIATPAQVVEQTDKEDKPRIRPAAIDIHDLEQELAKIHTASVRPHILLHQQPLTALHSVNTTPTEGLSQDNVGGSKEPQQLQQPQQQQQQQEEMKVSRFHVSLIPETTNKQTETKNEMKTGRFSVVTHEERDLFKSHTFYTTTGSTLLLGTASSNEVQVSVVSYTAHASM